MGAITLPALGLFVATLALAILSPGPAIIAASRSAAARGRQASMPYAMGLAIGASFWCLFALFGLTVLFRVLPQSYTVLRFLGGAYLIWIAVQMWRHAADPLAMEGESVTGPGFLQGLALNLSNPKPALFYAGVIMTIFPVLSTAGAAIIYLVALTVEVCFYAAVTVLMATGPMRRGYRAAKTAIDRVAGTLIGALGLTLILRH
ncbi:MULTISPECIES: LysE family translocator [unclassified Paracoccus (in: a-proteobacteria)]|uniref:LysE family translocator n=1 Tax=unclassified Paracoccus (in: a-proteobacteria) TaxID=2688777 RepID=UPI0016026444|nr:MULTISPECIES: LysE family transporter [unclassified Paracoccus (in: a-proteobacteria)]MBB1490811.1 LysE family transporter [Paracoccus sp. MC1854]MBB1497845.1 LysE family transporter [Paracoccus sp. MC1862]QQO45314.1 LysE family transporter [Paracoccus sp. MC1862]